MSDADIITTLQSRIAKLESDMEQATVVLAGVLEYLKRLQTRCDASDAFVFGKHSYGSRPSGVIRRPERARGSKPFRLIASFLGMVALLALAGCGGTPEKADEFAVNVPGQIGSNVLIPRQEIPGTPARTSRSGWHGHTRAGQAGANAGAAKTVPSRVPQRDALTARRRAKPVTSKLIGMPAKEISSLLGKPTLRHRESPGQVWQYAADDCVLYVFLYNSRTKAADPARVRYVESRDPNTAAREPTLPCVNQFLRRHAAGDVS